MPNVTDMSEATGYRAPQLNRRKRRPRNEAVARRVKARSEDGPKSARHRGDELGGWAATKVQGEGEISPLRTFRPYGLIRHYGCPKNTPAKLAEGQRMSRRVNVRVNNDSTEPDTQVSNTKLPLASFQFITALSRGPCIRCCHRAQLTTEVAAG